MSSRDRQGGSRFSAILPRFAAILLLALAISSLISSLLLGNNMLQDKIDAMLQTISVVEYALEDDIPLQEQLLKIRADTQISDDVRLTVIQRDGSVLADTGLDRPEEVENHLQREEVMEALEKGTGHASRYSESLSKHLLYVAKLTQDGERVIRFAQPYTNLLDHAKILMPILLVGVVVAFVISVMLTAQFSRNLTNQRMQERMEQMEQDKRVRQEFFSNASHELKTPITSIRGYAELLCQGFVPDKETEKDFLGRILIETEHMTGLIDDILMISRLETKDAEATLTKVSLKSAVDEAMKSLVPQAAACGVTLEADAQDVYLQASVQQIRELLLNLMSNGIKYNHPGGYVRTRISQDETQVVIEVEDDGCGIDPQDQQRIFERFYRVDKGRSRKMGGTGLGLSIVKHITAYYGGAVTVESQLGRGSRFMVTIPLSGINGR